MFIVISLPSSTLNLSELNGLAAVMDYVIKKWNFRKVCLEISKKRFGTAGVGGRRRGGGVGGGAGIATTKIDGQRFTQ